MLTNVLAAVNTAHNGSSILCTLILIGAVIASVAVLISLVFPGFGPMPGRAASGGYGHLAPPLFIAIILWVVYFIACGD